MDDLDDIVDDLIDHKAASPDEVQSEIDRQVFFRRNSVNLVVGKRGSGKTYYVLRELLKLPVLGHHEFTQIHYITDKARDDTVDKFMRAFSQNNVYFNWVPTRNAEKLITAITQTKAMVHEDQSDEDYKMLCRALSSNPSADDSAELDEMTQLRYTQ